MNRNQIEFLNLLQPDAVDYIMEQEHIKRLSGMHNQIAQDVPQLRRGMVWCVRCGASQRVNSGNALRSGWPECCGETMTIDSPEERAALKAK